MHGLQIAAVMASSVFEGAAFHRMILGSNEPGSVVYRMIGYDPEEGRWLVRNEDTRHELFIDGTETVFPTQ